MKHLKTLLLPLIISSLLFSSCSPSTAQQESVIADEIKAVEAKTMIEDNSGNKNFVIIDTRSVREYEGGHLKNSVFINFSAPDVKEQVLKLDKTKTYLIYCHSGGRSGMIQDLMEKNGFEETYNLKDGIVSWRSEGFETVKD
jgi:rhodanese-related sulfurtransferase